MNETYENAEPGPREKGSRNLHLSILSITSRFPWLRRRSPIYFQELVANGTHELNCERVTRGVQ